MPYEKEVRYIFEIQGELLAVTDWSKEPDGDWLVIQECRKNGQEDTHMSGELRRNGWGEWFWFEGEQSFVQQESREFADDVLGFIQKNGIPK